MSSDRRRGVAVSGGLDAVWILVFVAIGRTAHTDGVTLAGMASTSWPFLAGAAAGWVVGRGWRRPVEIVPTGVVVWVSCVGVGMALRVVSGQGTAPAFVAVALGFLGMGLLGWRALARLGARRLHS
jgi:peptidoglycan/LPS O-acetylase OafA/YrhL